MDKQLAIPVIDFVPLLGQDSNQESFATASKEIYETFKKFGFVYIKNHSIPQEVVDEAFSWSKRFFALPEAEKDRVPHPPEGSCPRGYSAMGREKVSQMVFDEEGIAQQRETPDAKESYDMGTEGDGERMPNMWPPEDVIPGFQELFIRFYEACYGMEVKLLRAIAVGMGLEETFFLDYHKTKNNQLRLLHYPPVEEELMATGKVEGVGAHTDFGTLTMLFQDDVGGLEVEDVTQPGKFNPAPHVPGTMVVNIGDLLMRWSNDELRSTLHRVRTPADASEPRMTRERYSMPYFVGADDERTIDCVPGCWGPDRPKKYEPINCKEYVEMRLNALY